ncbi:MAG TPA: UDP binding domain-containing protein, partial [Reyranella sp.]|nr:UDP binding domain-containing protein [Reyranella sp.]
RMMPGIAFAKTAYEAATGADVLVVITEWHEFRGLDPRRLKEAMRKPRIVDLRNIFNPEEMRGLGFAYEAATGADVLVVITEWHEFRGLDPRRLKEAMRKPRVVDLRNIFNPEEMRGLGFAYEGVGRPRPRH